MEERLKGLIGLGINKLQNLSLVGKIYCAASISLPLLLNLHLAGYLPIDQSKKIETYYRDASTTIAQTHNSIVVEANVDLLQTTSIKDIGSQASSCNKLCKILATREVITELLQIIVHTEAYWYETYRARSPLDDNSIREYFNYLENQSLMVDCIDLLFSILPYAPIEDIPIEELAETLFSQGLSFPTMTALANTILNLMVKRNETIKPFIEDGGIIDMVSYFLIREYKSEYAPLRDKLLKISRVIYEDRYNYKMTFTSRLWIEEFYRRSRYQLWIPRELRVSTEASLWELGLFGVGKLLGWCSPFEIVYHYYLFSSHATIYRNLSSSFTRCFFSSFLATGSILFYGLCLKKRYLAFMFTSILLSMYNSLKISEQRTRGPLYKEFKSLYQDIHSIDLNDMKQLSTFKLIKDKSEILAQFEKYGKDGEEY